MKDQQPCVNKDISPRPCPRCNNQINSLRMYSKSEHLYSPSIEAVHDTRQISWEQTGSVDREEIPPDFECPVCSEVLFTDQEAAEQWLLNPNSVKMPMFTNKFYNILRLSRDDVAQAFDQYPHLAEAAAFIPDFEMERLANKITDAILDGGNYQMAIECWFEDILDEMYVANKKAILNRIKGKLTACPECDTEPSSIEERECLDKHGLCEVCCLDAWKDLEVCPTCGMNPNTAQSEEQQAWELEYVQTHGQCSACDLEDSEREGVENAIRKTADPREIEGAREKTDAE